MNHSYCDSAKYIKDVLYRSYYSSNGPLLFAICLSAKKNVSRGFLFTQLLFHLLLLKPKDLKVYTFDAFYGTTEGTMGRFVHISEQFETEDNLIHLLVQQ